LKTAIEKENSDDEMAWRDFDCDYGLRRAGPGCGKEIIRPTGTKPDGPYSPGILVDGTLYVSGQGGEDENGKIPVEFEAEVKQSLDNIGVVLKEAGMTPADVVSIQVFH